jgi:hypothetical protein
MHDSQGPVVEFVKRSTAMEALVSPASNQFAFRERLNDRLKAVLRRTPAILVLPENVGILSHVDFPALPNSVPIRKIVVFELISVLGAIPGIPLAHPV